MHEYIPPPTNFHVYVHTYYTVSKQRMLPYMYMKKQMLSMCHTPPMTLVLGLESTAAAPTWREPEGRPSTWRGRRVWCGVRGCTGGSW